MPVPARLQHLPRPMLSYLATACGRDWDRVVVDGMSATVLNQAPSAPPRRPASKPASKAATEKSVAKKSRTARALKAVPAPQPEPQPDPQPVAEERARPRSSRVVKKADAGERPGLVRVPTAEELQAHYAKKAHRDAVKQAEREGHAPRQSPAEVAAARGWTTPPTRTEPPAAPPAPPAPAVRRDPPPILSEPLRRPGGTAPRGGVFVDGVALRRDDYVPHRQPQATNGPTDLKFEAAVAEARVTGYALVERFKGGLPATTRVQWHADVLALYGLDRAMAEAVIRSPSDVQLDVTTKKRTYSVLRFYRGDVYVCLGFKTPTTPMVVAVYVVNHDHETENVRAGTAKGSGSGGRSSASGGTRRQSGLPTTVNASVSRLQGAGAVVEWSEIGGARTASVTFSGQDLGKITMEKVTRQQIQSDYQRLIRKMDAIRRRQSQAG